MPFYHIITNARLWEMFSKKYVFDRYSFLTIFFNFLFHECLQYDGLIFRFCSSWEMALLQSFTVNLEMTCVKCKDLPQSFQSKFNTFQIEFERK